MASTTIYSVKSTLLTKLQAESDLSGIQVTYGDPGGAARREFIFIGDVTAGGQDPESLSSGRRRRIETYTLDVIVSVQSKPQGLQENEQRAIVLASAVENCVADPPPHANLDGLMIIECSGMSVSSNEAGMDGPHSLITVHFTVKGRLS